jgi:hypothetical protein
MILRKMLTLFQVVIGIFLVMTFFIAGPRVEKLLFPVVSEFDIDDSDIIRLEDKTAIYGILIKSRNCDPVSGSLTAYVQNLPDANGIEYQKEINVSFPKEDYQNSRPTGPQYFGPWYLTAPGPPLGPSMILRVQHRCHPFWKIETVLYVGETEKFFSSDQINERDPS